MVSISDIRKNVFEYHWLRPESALWIARDIEVIKEMGFELKGKCLDFGCGEGSYSFMLSGGKINPKYDMYTFIDTKIKKGGDIYNKTSQDRRDWVASRPSIENTKIIGFDKSSGLLQKTKNLCFYDRVIEGDGNKVLPFGEQEFDCIFSNMIYWLESIRSPLEELRRITKTGGILCLLVPNNNAIKSSAKYRYANYSFEKDFVDILDNGRSLEIWRHAKIEGEWIKEIEETGWKIKGHKTYLSLDLLTYWDIGLRPYSKLLIEAFSMLDERERLSIKTRWVNDLMETFEGFLVAQGELEKKTDTTWECFICEK